MLAFDGVDGLQNGSGAFAGRFRSIADGGKSGRNIGFAVVLGVIWILCGAVPSWGSAFRGGARLNFGASNFTHLGAPSGEITPMSGTVKSMGSWQRMWLAGREDSGQGGSTMLSRPQEQSTWVLAAIDLVVGQITPLPLVWTANAESHEALASNTDRAAFWAEPGRTRAGGLRLCDVIELAGAWLKLRGICHFILDDTWLSARGTRRNPFILARPDRMRPIEDSPGGDLVGWTWTDARGRQHPLIADQVVTVRKANPLDEIGGLSSYSAASVAAEADVAAGNFAKNVSAANGQKGEYIIAEGGSPTQEQREQIVAALQEKKRRVRNGDFAPVFLSGGLRVEEAKISAVDAAFVSQRIENRHEIYAAMGVPMSLADVKAAYSIGADSDARQLVQGASMPLAEKLTAAFAKIETLRTRQMIHAEFKWADHPVIQALMMEKLEAAGKLADRGVPMRIVNETLGLGLPRFKGDDVGFVPFGVQPIEDAIGGGDAEETTAGPATTADDTWTKLEDAEVVQNGFLQLADTLQRAIEDRAEKRVTLALPSTSNVQRSTSNIQGEDGAGAVIQLGARSRANLWNRHQSKRAPFERKLGAGLRKVFGVARGKVLAALAGAAGMSEVGGLQAEVGSRGSEVGGKTKAGAYDFVLDLGDLQEDMWKATKPVLQGALSKAGNELMAEIGVDDPFTMAPKVAKNFLDVRENRIKDAGKEVYDQITSTLKEGFDAGETMDELAERVREKFAGISKRRAETIAATETASAYGVARHAAMEQAGITHKEWLTAKDDRVRAEHAAMDGVIAALDEPYVLDDGTQLMHPAEEGGPPEHVINCRCVSIAALKAEDNEEGS